MICAFANQKGGVGKTTTALNVAIAAGRLGAEVLAVDLDPQHAMSRQAGLVVRDLPATLVDVLGRGVPAREAAVLDHHGVDWLPGHPDLANVEYSIAAQQLGNELIRAVLDEMGADEYDIVVIDCPPNLGPLSINGIAAADRVVSPINVQDEGAAEGLVGLLNSIDTLGVPIPVSVLLTRHDSRRVAQADLTAAITAAVGDVVGPPIAQIPERSVIHQAANARTPLVLFAPDSVPAVAYHQLASDLIRTDA